MDWGAEEEEKVPAPRSKRAIKTESARGTRPTIEQVFAEFLADQSGKLKSRTAGQYAAVIDLLTHQLNGYGYEGLANKEEQLFNKHYNANGKAHREFVQLFGADKIVENLGKFLGYFMVRKVMAGVELKSGAGTAAKKLSQWLVAKRYIGEEEG